MRSIKKKDFEIWCISSNGFLILITACTDSLTQSERKENDGDRKTPSHAKSKTQREERWCSVIERWYYHYFFLSMKINRESEKKNNWYRFLFSFHFVSVAIEICYLNMTPDIQIQWKYTKDTFKTRFE